MRHAKITAAVIGAGVLAGTAGIASATGPSPRLAGAHLATAKVSSAKTTIHTAVATVSGNRETVLVNAAGLPLYYYKLDTPTKSFVTGGVKAAWPPLISRHPTITGANGAVTAVKTVNGWQVAYRGHFLYTFVSDKSGHATGQGVNHFYVATPGLAALHAAAPTQVTTSTTLSSAGYGY